MRAAVITESCFGNTAAVGEAIAQGLRQAAVDVDVYTADTAPARIAADLVVIGAPTHNRRLPSPATRREAARRGPPAVAGVREWIDDAVQVQGRIVAFATITGGRYAGSAGVDTVRRLKRRRLRAERGPDFVVTDVMGPLSEGELDRAQVWAARLAVEHA
jgi:hypothetical protein